MRDFEEPSYQIARNYEKGNQGEFVIGPFEKSLGNTIGNSLRRVLLSSLPGAAVYAIQIQGAQHEYCSLDGVCEDVLQIQQNLKNLVVKVDEDGDDVQKVLNLGVNGPKEVTAADIICPSNVEIVNPEHHIATLSEGGKLEITIFVNKGRGYVQADKIKAEYNLPIGTIPVDANYSPIKEVSYAVESTRVNNNTNYESLKFNIETNGSITPSDSLAVGARILVLHLNKVANVTECVEKIEFSKTEEVVDNSSSYESKTIEDLNLSVRSYNALKRSAIVTIGDLCSKSAVDMGKIKALGKKSLDEIEEKLKEFGLKQEPPVELGFKKILGQY